MKTSRHFWLTIAVLLNAAASFAADSTKPLTLPTRARVETAKGSNDWQVVKKSVAWDPKKTALVICDMWDKHWCDGATRRVAEMAPRMNEVVKKAREQGVLIIHCPSDTMKYYAGTTQRSLATSAPPATPKVPLQRWCSLDKTKEAPLPIDDSDGGCDDSPQCKNYTAWKQQIPVIEIKEGDAITDSAEAYHLMQQRGIDNVLVMGVHLNMCVLGRPFSIRQMIAQGKNVLLVRDMTDTMYNSRKRPFVPHCVGTGLMIEHVEKYWCPTTTSVAFLGGAEFQFKEDQRPRVLFLIGDEEYKTAETVPEWAKKELAWRGVNCSFVTEEKNGQFPGLEKLPEADALFISLKRRSLSPEQMALIKKHLDAGKAVIGIRTASHAFGAKDVAAGRLAWESFDRDILGGNYQNHYGKGPATLAQVTSTAAAHPILAGIPTNEIRFASHLYKCRDLAATTTVLLNGRLEQKPEIVEPIAWTNTNANRRVFYTSLGSPEDFQQPVFRHLLLNAVLWSVGQPIPPESVALAIRAPASGSAIR